MSEHIHDETKRGFQVKFRAPDNKVADFDDWVETTTYDSRADALRSLMEKAMHTTINEGTPLVPPSEQPLRKSYIRLTTIANHDGIIPHDVATSELGSYLGRQKGGIERTVLQKLRERIYIRQISNVYGDRSWKLRGMNDE